MPKSGRNMAVPFESRIVATHGGPTAVFDKRDSTFTAEISRLISGWPKPTTVYEGLAAAHISNQMIKMKTLETEWIDAITRPGPQRPLPHAGGTFRRGGRAVEGTGLENRQAGDRLVGSNPTPSAGMPYNY